MPSHANSIFHAAKAALVASLLTATKVGMVKADQSRLTISSSLPGAAPVIAKSIKATL